MRQQTRSSGHGFVQLTFVADFSARVGQPFSCSFPTLFIPPCPSVCSVGPAFVGEAGGVGHHTWYHAHPAFGTGGKGIVYCRHDEAGRKTYA